MQKLGQHFLRNEAVLQKIVGALELAGGDRVIEIGPGHGELTMPLMRAAEKKNCAITSIEKDHALIPALTTLAGEAAPGMLSIIEGDALKLLPEIASAEITPRDAPHYKIVGNIPYYITGKLLRVIGELEKTPERTVLLIQKEVAHRICAVPPTMNRLAASVQFWADAEIVAHVPRADFSPPPDVDSAVIMLKKKKISSTVDPALYYKAVRAIFSQPRKTLLNNLSAIAQNGVVKKDVAKIIEGMGIDPAARPQDLTIEAVIALAEAPLWG